MTARHLHWTPIVDACVGPLLSVPVLNPYCWCLCWTPIVGACVCSSFHMLLYIQYTVSGLDLFRDELFRILKTNFYRKQPLAFYKHTNGYIELHHVFHGR
jgi:hypothetical protein